MRVCLVLVLASCGRLGFDPVGTGVPEVPVGPDPDPSGSPTAPPADLTGDGAPDVGVIQSASEGLLHVYSLDASNPSVTVAPHAMLEGSSECGARGGGRYVSLRGFGEGMLFGFRCSTDRNLLGGVATVFGGVPAGDGTFYDHGSRRSFAEQQTSVEEMALDDVDGDGTVDLVTAQPASGTIRLVLDLASELAATLTLITFVGATGERAGAGLAVVDVTGDGVLDLAIGAPLAGGTGRVYIVPGPLAATTSSPLASVATIVLSGVEGDERFGAALAAWDADRDGVRELVVGAPGGGGGAGRVFGFTAPLTGNATEAVAQWTIAGLAGDGLGAALATGGDVDRDGAADLLIGADATTDLRGVVGSIAVFTARSGFASASAASAHLRYLGDWPGAPWFRGGFVGDLDGDGRADLAASADTSDGGTLTIHTSAGGFPPTGGALRWTLEPGAAFGNARFVIR